ncbi:MAG: type IV secretion system DNA-binding domain-containing protein, partial [Patescibacteria group bacterium]|nr:type IV secretion system DNA-binding domain-containing protein [Patescibacteria group bacterium]
KLTDEDSATLQIMFSPANDNWRKAGKKKARDIFEGKKGDHSLPVQILIWFMKILTLQINDLGDKKDGDKRDYRVTPKEEEQVKALEEKASEVGFRCVMRLISVSSHEFKAEANLGMIANAFSQYNEPDLNEFKFISPSGFGKERKIRQIIEKYLFRYLHRTDPVMILNTEELASIFHLPDSRYNTAPVIKWQNSRIAPPPQNIPKEGIILGDSFYRGQHTLVRISHEDRFRHFYIIGQTGTGKSVGLTNMILQDMKAGFGLCVMDPHGSLAKDVMEYIPRERAEDVIYFNPADTSRPLGLNLLEAETVEEKDLVAMDALNIMIKLYGEEIFSPRLQDYFRNGVLTLMDDEKEGGSLIDVVPLFTSPVFQKYKRTKVKNPVVKSWWNDTYDSMGDREKEEMIPYFAAKFGAFVTNTTMRNVLGQAKSAFDFGEAMQNNKLILVNLSKGLIGELNSNLLGMIIVSKIQMAAMRRESIPKQNRKDFFFYIDEFQNFITESIESILSEARKYRLGMVMANQYIAQLTDKGGDRSIGDKIKNAVFGNVGTLWSYKVSAEDAEYLEKEFSPVFNQRDLNNLDIFHACLKLTINGVQTPPFSIVARKPWELEEFQKMKNPEKVTNAIKELARLQWGKDKKFVEAEILGRLGI